jgi:subtilase family serine protease
VNGNHDDLVETDAHQLDRLSPRHWARLRRTTTVETALLGLVVLGLVALAASCGGGAKPPFQTASKACESVRPTGSGTGDCDSLTTCYTPRQLESAYGILPLLARGIDGRGETVVLPELAGGLFPSFSYSDLRQDLARFDQLFALPAPKLRVDNSIAKSRNPWRADGEEVLDAEMVHAAAPGAAITILLVKASSLNSAKNAVAASVAALGWNPVTGLGSPNARFLIPLIARYLQP